MKKQLTKNVSFVDYPVNQETRESLFEKQETVIVSNKSSLIE